MEYQAYLSVHIQAPSIRAWLFDNLNGQYELVHAVTQQISAPSDLLPMQRDLEAQLIELLQRLQLESGHKLLDDEGQLIHRDYDENRGVRAAALSFGNSRPIRTVLVATSAAYSLTALRRLGKLLNLEIAAEICAQDEQNATAQLMNLLETDADLFLIAGGTDGGSQKALRTSIENIRVLLNTQPRIVHPQIVYLGNEALGQYAQKELDIGPNFHLAPNIIPVLGQEDLLAGWTALSAAYRRVLLQLVPGLSAVEQRLATQLLPSELCSGRMIRLLEAINPSGKGILSIHLGAESLNITAAQSGELISCELSSCPDPGQAQALQRTIPAECSLSEIKDYLLSRLVYPAYKPATRQDMLLELAWTCLRIQNGLQEVSTVFPEFDYQQGLGLYGAYEPIILSGDALKLLPSQAHILLMAIEALCPHGITTIVLDQDQILTALGALAAVEPLLPAQLIDSGIFENLATLITVTGPVIEGRKMIDLELDQGKDQMRGLVQVKAGEFKCLGLEPQSSSRLYLSPQSQVDAGMGQAGLGGWLRTSGGNLGVIIDARGRPLPLPGNAQEHAKKLQDWLNELEG